MIAPLFVRSAYSFHWGTAMPAVLAKAAKKMGYESLALTDRNSVHGIPVFEEACGKEGIKPIFGAELRYEGGRSLLLARTRAGFSAICRILSLRSEGRLDARAILLGRQEGLSVLTDDVEFLATTSRNPELYALLTLGNRRYWKALIATGQAPIAAPEVVFFSPEDRKIQRLLVAIGSNRCVDEVREEELAGPEAVVVDPEAMCREFAGVPEALTNNEKLCESVEMHTLFGGWVFPHYPTGNGERAADLLRKRVLIGASKRYGSIKPKIRERIDYELRVIEEKGFSDYFLVVKDIVSGASRSCGRGSAAASVVSYALGITDVDPIRHGLYFERFLNPGRTDPPDIDVDFAWDERDDLLAGVIAGFGEAHAARVANHVCFQPRSALRETARALGLPDGEISAFEQALTADPLRTCEDTDATWKGILLLSESLIGLPRHLGVHSGGLIVVPDALCDHVPLERTGTGIRVTAWDKEGVEASGLIKIDLLGNRSLAVVRDALANLEGNGNGIDEDLWKPIDDAATVELLARGDSMGVFYVESPAMRMLQKKTGKGDFEHLVIHSSIIRPAANRFINEYIDRLKGKPYMPLHPRLSGQLAETYGIMCYQEDVCKAAIALADFSAMEADKLRKILSKKDVGTRIEAYRSKFFEGARGNNVAERTIAEVWAMIVSFSGYSFVKAHSASYAMLSFRSAYLRRHHPAEFMASVLSNHGGYYSTLAYVSESRRMGLTVRPPDVNASETRCIGRGNEIRFGLSMITSFGEAAVVDILEERAARGPFSSVEDFSRRVSLDRTAAEALVGSGALDSLTGGPYHAETLMRLLCVYTSGESDGQRSAELAFDEAPVVRAKQRRPDSVRKILEAEMRYLGTTLGAHPLELWPQALSRPRSLARDLSRLRGRIVDLVGWPITSKPVLTATEDVMEFISFEDETALYETVLFPDALRRFRHLLFSDGPLLVRGRVEEDRGAISVTVMALERVR